LLAAALSSQGCPWYREYFVYEEYRDYDQGQFICQVRVLTLEGDQVQHVAHGIGVTEEQSVQEAAYYALTRYREDCPYLADVTSPFCHFPSATEGTEGIYLASYADSSLEMDPRYRAVVEFL
jgi:hypothetical protein